MFIVLSSPAIPEHLRGFIGRFLVQIDPNVFVGVVAPPIADEIWQALNKHAPDTASVMVRSDPIAEPGYRILQNDPTAQIRIEDFDGWDLPVRTNDKTPGQEVSSPHTRG